MKQSVISELTTAEVAEKITEEREAYRTLKMNHVVSPLENPMVLRAKRKTIARLETEFSKRQRFENK